MEIDVAARFRWQASMSEELWQADALHGLVLINPATGRPQRAILFGLLDDRSRIVPYLEAAFGDSIIKPPANPKPFLRSLQRITGTAIALVHHVRKNVSANAAADNSLRGSGDLYAWVDSFVCLRSHDHQRMLSAEHRCAPAFGPVALQLVQAVAGTYLKTVAACAAVSDPKEDGLTSKIVQLLAKAPAPLNIDNLKTHLQVRNQRVVEAIREPAAQGRVQRQARGFALPNENQAL